MKKNINDFLIDESNTPKDRTNNDIPKPELISNNKLDELELLQTSEEITAGILSNKDLPSDVVEDLNTTFDDQLQNNPDDELGKSLELASETGIIFEYEDEITKKLAETIAEEYPEKGQIESSLLAGIVTSVTSDLWKNAVSAEFVNYNEDGDRINVDLLSNEDDKNDEQDKRDLDCSDIQDRDFKVGPDDPHGFDRDGDGIGCESNNEYKNDEQDNDICHPDYESVCIPYSEYDLDCDEIKYSDFKVGSKDPYGFDRDGDGIGCESNNEYKKKTDTKHTHHYHTKKIIKYQGSKCDTQTASIPLTGSIGPRTPIILGDFDPCELKDGRATLNLPKTDDLGFVVMNIDNKKGKHECIIVDNMDKVQNIANGNALFIVDFDDKMKGEDPITGEKKTLKDINGIVLYNKSKKTIDFKSGNGLAISAVLK